jgi:hypothetical protein
MPDFLLPRKLAELKASLDSNPTNVEAASRYWSALGSLGGNEVRSGGYLIEAFRACALDSKEGVIAFARAYEDLSAKTGEEPRPDLFDESLLVALRDRLSELPEPERRSVEWILSFIK